MLVYCFASEQKQVDSDAPGASKALMMAYLGGSVAVAVALGLLCAYDVTRYLGNRAVEYILFDGREITPAPELEKAARLRKTDPLEAIRFLRDYLQKQPGDVQVMASIAEIYERDLHNPLAAALEYEELLKLKLESERWGWAAIHLANLYIRLREEDKAVALLERIVREHGETAAAAKARKRLGLDEEAEEE